MGNQPARQPGSSPKRQEKPEQQRMGSSLSPDLRTPARQSEGSQQISREGGTRKGKQKWSGGQEKFVDSRYTLADSILKMTLQHKIDSNVNQMVQSRLNSLPVSQASVSKVSRSGPGPQEEAYDHYLRARFVGEKVDGKPNGFGKMYFQNNDYLEGTFVNGRCEGEGRIIKSDGSYYEGEIKNNEADGHGRFCDVQGYRYEGQWKNNFPNGVGEASYPDGSRYIGEFLNNKKHGNGVFIKDGDVFDGEFKNDKVDGMCTFTNSKGERYVGGWSKGLKHGHGTYQWPDGKKYEGDYLNDQRHGQGTMYYSQVQKYTGEWQGGQKHGPGVYESDKQKMSGLWTRGSLSKILP